MEINILMDVILPFLISLAANERSSAIHKGREEALDSLLKDDEKLQRAIIDRRTFRDEFRAELTSLARSISSQSHPPSESALWGLLADQGFQAAFLDWFMSNGIEEGKRHENELGSRISKALKDAGVPEEQVEFISDKYFETIEHKLYSNPTLARWRHSLNLEYLQREVKALRQLAEEAAGYYSPEKKKQALDAYCQMSLNAWDIIDLSNLPEGDIDIATQRLLLRELFIPLKVEASYALASEAQLLSIENRRSSRRLLGAGRLFEGNGKDAETLDDEPQPIGQWLSRAKRVVVLGDPGGGKTTILRWMATAYLLKLKGDAELARYPAVDTLPANDWLPVLVRCRDLGHDTLSQSFTDLVCQHFKSSELQPQEADVMRAVVLEKMSAGGVLLLVDGLDEVSDIEVRMRFCRQLELTAARYPQAHIVATSRIVGYRDMPYRIGEGFSHGTIAELTRQDKDDFARRWVAVTEEHKPKDEREQDLKELIEALHSSDRIERITSNPLLLTTMALIKRKVGKLPNRRHKLYEEAMGVLLNWNPRVHAVIEEEEALPQLEYVAYEMCRRGVQVLEEDDLLGLLDEVRERYPNVRAIKKHSSEDFLKLLEARSSILIKSGGAWHKATRSERPVWEFRHLTFQEYLAGRALVDGKHPGYERSQPLAARIAPLAATVVRKDYEDRRTFEFIVSDSWREALRLCIAGCKDEDVDDALLSIMDATGDDRKEETGRARAVLAATCLADEPNVSEDVARMVLKNFASYIGEGDDSVNESSLYLASLEVGRSMWRDLIRHSLMEEFMDRKPDRRHNVGYVLGAIARVQKFRQSYEDTMAALESTDDMVACAAALSIHASDRFSFKEPKKLIALFGRSLPLRWASILALLRGKSWRPDREDTTEIISLLNGLPTDEHDSKRLAIMLLGRSSFVTDPSPIIACLSDLDISVRLEVVDYFAMKKDKIDRKLLLQDMAGTWPYIDPWLPITISRVEEASTKLNLPEEEVKRRYEALSKELRLNLEWVDRGPEKN